MSKNQKNSLFVVAKGGRQSLRMVFHNNNKQKPHKNRTKRDSMTNRRKIQYCIQNKIVKVSYFWIYPKLKIVK